MIPPINNIEKNSSERYYPALDGLRGVAALMIVWYHFLLFVPMHGVVLSFLTKAFGFGWAGVDLFFVLSGFLITGILVDSKTKTHYFRTFYGRRVLRIFPLYYGFLVVVFFILPLVRTEAHVWPSTRIFFWTYTSNFYFAANGWVSDNYLTHLWTLAIEEQFYLVWPLVIFFVTNIEHLRRGLLWAFLSVSFLRCILYLYGVDFQVLYLNTFTRCDALMLGGYLALSVRSAKPDALKLMRPSRFTMVVFLLIAFLLTDLNGFMQGWNAIPLVAFCRAGFMFSIFAILFAWLIFAATHRSGYIFRLFSHTVLRWLGKYSYALYVLHVPIAYMILRSQIAWISSVPAFAEIELLCLYLGTCILAAFLSWHLYEKHFLKLKKYFRNE